MIKKILYVFIPVLTVLLMSHNTFAVDTIFDITTYEPVIRQIYDRVDCSIVNITSNATTNISNQHFCMIAETGEFSISSITTHHNLSYKKGDIIEFDFISFTEGFYNNDYFIFETPSLSDNNNFRIMSYKDVTSGYYFDVSSLNSSNGSIGAGVQFYKVIRFTIYVNNDFTGLVGLSTPNVTQHPVARFAQHNLARVYSNIVNLVVYRNRSDGQSQDQKNEISETNDAVADSESGGVASGTSSQNATSSLLSVITSGIGAITSASPTNCKINGNMGNLNVGNIDLCANPVPTFMSLIGSIIAVLVVLPLVIVLFNRFISIIRSFQR